MVGSKITEADKIDFIDDVVELCERHGVWLSHEDPHGGFQLTRERTHDWLTAAMIVPYEAETPQW